MVSTLFQPGWRLTDANGKPVNNGKLYVYDAGTTDDASVYSDSALSAALPQPIRTDSGGLPITSGDVDTIAYVAGGANYKIVAKTSADVTLWTYDEWVPLGLGAGTVAVAEGGTGATTAAGARTNLGAASASELSTLSTTVSGIDSELDSVGGSLGDVSALDLVTPAYLGDGLDDIVLQAVRSTSATKSTLSGATIPQDSSIPQSSEGEQIFSQSFTPTRSDSTIRVTSQVHVEYSAARQAMLCLFTSGSTDAIQTSHGYFTANTMDTITLEHEFASPGTSAITISIRLGADSTTAPQLNGPHFDSVPVSWMKIEEIIDTPLA